MNLATIVRDKIVNALLPRGYTPPRSVESNLHTQREKARRRRQKERLRKLEGRT